MTEARRILNEMVAAIDKVNECACALSQLGYTVEYETIDVTPIGRPEYPVLRQRVFMTTELGVDDETGD